jgi:predicted nucleotidyltransferase
VPTNPLIESHRTELAAVCRRRRVRVLELFGSAVRGDFDTTRSDLDFLVEFLPLREGEHADAYFGLLEDLETLFQRPIDLVMTRAIRNRYFAEGIRESRTTLYAA